VSGVGYLLVKKHNDAVPIAATDELSSTGCSYPVSLENHSESVQCSSSFPDKLRGAIVVWRSLELDLACEKVRQRFLYPLPILGGIDWGFSDYEDF
jgi:hypothetical protein